MRETPSNQFQKGDKMNVIMKASGRANNAQMMYGVIRLVDLTLMEPNDQLTDGGPSVTLELPSGMAGPPFGEAPGSVFLSCLCQSRNHSAGSLT